MNKFLTKNFFIRLLSGVFYAGLVLFASSYSPLSLWLLMMFFLIICTIEFIRLVRLTDWIHLILLLSVLAIIGYYYSRPFWDYSNHLVWLPQNLLPGIMFFLLTITVFKFAEELKTDFGKFTAGAIFLSSFSVALSLVGFYFDSGIERISKEVFFIFILIFISDTFAYLFGSLFGKHKMAPSISPKKTWEGFVGGLLFVLIGGYCIHHFKSENLNGNWLIISGLVGVFAPLGDLFESKLKREFMRKDSSNWLPGHGGFLDRLDSFILTVPAVHFYFIILNIF